MDKKINRLEAELNTYREKMKKMRDGPAKVYKYIYIYLVVVVVLIILFYL